MNAEDLRNLKIVHFAMVTGVSAIMVILHVSVKRIDLSNFENISTIGIVGALLALSAIVISNAIFRQRMLSASQAASEISGEVYRTNYILRWAILEGAALINIVLYFFLEDQAILIASSLVVLVVLYFAKPITQVEVS